MRYLCIYKPAKPEGARPPRAKWPKWDKFVDEMKKAGVLLATEGCQPSSQGARIRLTDESSR
jgi:hypothetical protein